MTGVQTCALPIFVAADPGGSRLRRRFLSEPGTKLVGGDDRPLDGPLELCTYVGDEVAAGLLDACGQRLQISTLGGERRRRRPPQIVAVAREVGPRPLQELHG